MQQQSIANRISMLEYWKPLRGVCLYLQNYNYETVYASRILKCLKSEKTGIWYVMIRTAKGSVLQYRIDDIILIRKVDPKFTTLDVICHGRKKMFEMRQRGRL